MTDFMNRILWATDCSDEAHEAFTYADIFAKTFGAEIFGLHVMPGFSPEHYQSAIVVIDELKKRMEHMRNIALPYGVGLRAPTMETESSSSTSTFPAQ